MSVPSDPQCSVDQCITERSVSSSVVSAAPESAMKDRTTSVSAAATETTDTRLA